MSPLVQVRQGRVWSNGNCQCAKVSFTMLRQHSVQLGVRKGSVAIILLDFETIADEF